MTLKTITLAFALASAVTAASAGTFIYRKPMPSGTKCASTAACKLPSTTPEQPPAGDQFNGVLLANQALAVAHASAVCYYSGNPEPCLSPGDLAQDYPVYVPSLSASPTPVAGAIAGAPAWTLSQNFVGRTFTAAFKVRSVDVNTGQSTWSTVMVAGAPTGTTYKNYARLAVQSHNADVYLDGGEYAAFNYSATLSGVTDQACAAVSDAGVAGASCTGGVLTAIWPAPFFSSVGVASAPGSASRVPTWAASTVAFPQ